MKHRIAEFVFVMLFLFVTLFNMIGLAVSAFDHDISDLPQGTFLYSVMSPNGTSTLKIYRVTVTGIGNGIRGELITTDEAGQTVTQNVYWETHVQNAIAAFISDKEINVNGHEFDVTKEVYDSRREVELPEYSAKNILKQKS